MFLRKKYCYQSRSSYGKIQVQDTVERGVPVRLLLVNGTRESATYLVPGLQNEPVFEYIRTITRMTDDMDPFQDVLLIGGAGFSLPKFFISRYREMTIDVVENNPEMLDIARKYFFLEELYREYDLEHTGRLNIILDDGYRYLETCRKTYDIIINDAFVGRVADRDPSSDKGSRMVYACLKPGGTYFVNLTTAREGVDSMNGIMAEATISRVFGKAAMIPVYPDYSADYKQNVIVRAVKEARVPEYR